MLVSPFASNAQDPSKMDSFIDDLMSKMTLREKLGQTNLPAVPSEIVTGNEICQGVFESIRKGEVGGVINAFGDETLREYQRMAVEESRLGIPLLCGLDVIHGYRTIFPIPLTQARSWDPSLLEKTARAASEEAATEGVSWVFNPMVDVCRDPRWGRVAEGTGEDDYLNGLYARAFVRGSQSAGVAASVKHFALYGASEGGRDYRETDMSLSRMYNEYLSPYKAAVDEGVLTVMTSFNDINGVPATAAKWLQTDILRGEWGFKGVLVSDYNALGELIPHAQGDLKEVTAKAVNAGLDMDMVTGGVLRCAEALLDEGKITMEQIDRACRRILELKYILGLFGDPYRFFDRKAASQKILSSSSKDLARKAADASLVLLKNENGLLPLDASKSVALIGPLSDDGDQYGGCWSCLDPHGHKTLKAALEERGVKVVCERGSNFLDDALLEQQGAFQHPYVRDTRSDETMTEAALEAARRCDVTVAAMGEMAAMTGEGVSRARIYIPEPQRRLLEKLSTLGKPIVLVLFTGRPLVLSWESERIPAILDCGFPGSQGADAIADALLGVTNPSGKLTMSYPYDIGQIPVYYNMKPVGRPVAKGAGYVRYNSCYFDVPNEPIYPFGYGLSYTTFSYGGTSLSATALSEGGSIRVSTTVTNTGEREGDEIVQLYIRDVVSSESRPLRQLKGFRKVHLRPGESTEVEFTITPETLSWYYLESGTPTLKVEDGEFEVFISKDSESGAPARFTYSM